MSVFTHGVYIDLLLTNKSYMHACNNFFHLPFQDLLKGVIPGFAPSDAARELYFEVRSTSKYNLQEVSTERPLDCKLTCWVEVKIYSYKLCFE